MHTLGIISLIRLNKLKANMRISIAIKYIFWDPESTSNIVSNFSDISLSIREFKDRFAIIRNTFNETMPDNLGLQNNRNIVEDNATINPFNYFPSFI